MKMLNFLTAACLIFTTAQPQAATPWVACGTLNQMTVGNGGTIPGKPVNSFEYGIAYLSNEPVPVLSSLWNSGIRVYNKDPMMVWSDNPDINMRQGGFVFYASTAAADDNVCDGVGQLRHRYWWNDTNNIVSTGASNGCFGANIPIYCRLRN